MPKFKYISKQVYLYTLKILLAEYRCRVISILDISTWRGRGSRADKILKMNVRMSSNGGVLLLDYKYHYVVRHNLSHQEKMVPVFVYMTLLYF